LGSRQDEHQDTAARPERAIEPALHYLAEVAAKDIAKFVSRLADGGYFYDVSGGKNTTATTSV